MDSVLDERTLRELYLAGFERVVRTAAPWAIMSSYNLINGTYAHENRHLLTDILRNEWGFDGAVVSDWGGSNDAVAALRAGGSLEMPSPGLGSAVEILDAIRSGELAMADVDARVAELALLASRTRRGEAPVLDVEAHHALARRVAAAATVLLRNTGDILPLPPATKVAVIGDFAATPRYQGAGSSLVNPTKLVTALEALKATELDVVGYAQGFTRDDADSPELAAEALALAARADVVLLYLGLPEIAESEGRDREHMDLPAPQVRLLEALHAAGSRVVVVLSAGSAVEMPWLEACDALVHGHLSGQAGAEGVLDVMTGAVNPSGRLAETYPLTLADTPTAGRFPVEDTEVLYREAMFVGYRYYSTAEVPVRFPFGFGLSYTTFGYTDLALDASGAEVTVTNTGAVAGTETVQLYVGREGESAVLRPRLELRAFARVTLAPGESQRVRLAFDDTTFRYFDVATSAWQTEGGVYLVTLGSHVRDLRVQGTVSIAGSTSPAEASDAVAPVLGEHYRTASVAKVSDAEFAALLGRPLPAAPTTGNGRRRLLHQNSTLSDLRFARSPLARFAAWILSKLIDRSIAKGKPDLNLLFLWGMPLRAIGKMTNGALNGEMVTAMVTLVNGRHFAGLGGLISAAFRNRRTSKALSRELAASAARRA